ncbi:MAG: NAD(P)/FAD-dependent oxidoreductase [Acidobacteriota bacterium]
MDFKVLVIGAGAAGLAAGFALERRGVEFEILEASSRIGGRMKRISDFADFPIDLGAEWIHTAPSILEELAHDPEAGRKFEVVKYNPWISTWKGGRIRKNRLASLVYAEHKFKRTTWFGFFEKHLASRIQGRIRLDSPVRAIDVSGRRVQVITQDGTTHKADRIIVTVPLTVLKEAEIQFTPELPGEKVAALNRLSMPDGLKLFFEFRERFYPDLLQGGPNKIQGWGEKIYYDAAFKKDSSRNILGLFTVGDPARPYATAATDQETVDLALDELDRIFGGAASKHHVKHVVQNWSKEPFIRGSYTFDTDAATRAILRSPLEGKVFFAGETYAESWATVHGAALSGFEAVDQVLESTSRTF